jgi:hypothetical protein
MVSNRLKTSGIQNKWRQSSLALIEKLLQASLCVNNSLVNHIHVQNMKVRGKQKLKKKHILFDKWHLLYFSGIKKNLMTTKTHYI